MRFREVPIVIALVGLASTLGAAPQARAISLTITPTAATSAANVNQIDYRTFAGVPNSGVERKRAFSVLDSGGSTPDRVGATVDARTRLAMMLSSDADRGSFQNRNDSLSGGFDMDLTITPDSPLAIYSVTINLARYGALVVRKEGTGIATADVSAVYGDVDNEDSHQWHNITLPDIAGISTAETTEATLVKEIAQTASMTFTGRGVQVFNMSFRSSINTISNSNISSDAGESVVLMGLSGEGSMIGAADDYASYPGRSAANDGLFVDISVKLTSFAVPEPTSLAMAGIGGLGLVLTGLRRRQQVAKPSAM